MAMKLSDLTAYAREKYHIREEFRWPENRRLSVLINPYNQKWAALLMRQWDEDTGEEVEVCDIRCGREVLKRLSRPFIQAPFRMHGIKWIGVRFDERTDRELVLRLFDKALFLEDARTYTVELPDLRETGKPQYMDTALPAKAEAMPDLKKATKKEYTSGKDISQKDTSEKNRSELLSWLEAEIFSPEERQSDPESNSMIEKMKGLYEPGDGSFRQKCKNFYLQGMFMKDYEDDLAYNGQVNLFIPTYHDLNTRQLRGYFAWRTGIRKGDYKSTCAAFAEIYIYELLNGIGVSSPEETFQKLDEFKENYLDAGFGNEEIRESVRRWAFEYAVIKGMPVETAYRYMDPALKKTDEDLMRLRFPDRYSDREVYLSMCSLAGIRPDASPVIQKNEDEGMHLFAEVWRKALTGYMVGGQDLFTQCFGRMYTFRFSPLRSAVYRSGKMPEDAEYRLSECRLYYVDGGQWMEQCCRKLYFDKILLEGIYHETDRNLRKYLNTGRALRKRDREAFLSPFVDEVIEEDRRMKKEAARPKIEIDFSNLDRIRSDALITRDSLLTDDEKREIEVSEAAVLEETGNPGKADNSASQKLLQKTEQENNILERTAYSERTAYLERTASSERTASLERTASSERTAFSEKTASSERTASSEECALAADKYEYEETYPEAGEGPGGSPILDETQQRILRVLLRGDPVDALLRDLRLMPSIVADAINEALFDEIGDSVIECDGSTLCLIEDYREDLEQYI